MFILCQGDLAKEPYIIPISEVPVYSLEELCYYMYHNIYTVTEDFFDENLVHWLKGQVHLRTLAMKMEKLIRKHHNIKDLVVTLLCACDYYKKEEISKGDVAVELSKLKSDDIERYKNSMQMVEKEAMTNYNNYVTNTYPQIVRKRNLENKFDSFMDDFKKRNR